MVGMLSGGPSAEQSRRRPRLEADSSRLLSDQAGDLEDGQGRTLSVWQRQEIQEVLRGMNALAPLCARGKCQGWSSSFHTHIIFELEFL